MNVTIQATTGLSGGKVGKREVTTRTVQKVGEYVHAFPATILTAMDLLYLVILPSRNEPPASILQDAQWFIQSV
jgi:hypothetical protein